MGVRRRDWARRIHAMNLLMQPEYLSMLFVPAFKNLERKYLFAELARLDKLIEAYPALIESVEETQLKGSLRHCEMAALTRYNELRQLVCAKS